MVYNRKNNMMYSEKENNKIQLMITTGLSMGIFVVLFLLRNLFPFGKGSILMIDLHSQYVPLLYRFYDVITGQKNLFMDFSASGGAYLYADTINEILNPFNYLLLLFGRDNIYLSVNILLVCYVTAAAIAACFCLQKIWPKHQEWNVPLSLCYAFSGFVAAQFQIIKWMYLVVLFPIFVLALLRVLYKKKWGAYALILAYQIMLSLQLGFMVLLFTLFGSAFYFIYLKKKQQISEDIEYEERNSVSMALVTGTIVAVLIAALVWVPNVLQLLNSVRGGENQTYFSLMKQHGLHDLFERLYQIFHPVIFVMGVFYFRKACCKKGGKRQTLSRELKYLLAWNIFLCITVIAQPSNLVWHLGSYRCFPVRYAYMVLLSEIFCVKYLVAQDAGQNMEKIPMIQKKKEVVLYTVSMICCVLAFLLTLYWAVPLSQGFSSLDVSNVPSVVTKVVGILGLLVLAGFAALCGYKQKKHIMTVLVCAAGMIYFLFVMLPQDYEVRSLNESAYKEMTDSYHLQEDPEEMLLHREDKKEWPLNAALVSGGRTMTGYFPSGSGKEYAGAMEKMGYLISWVSTRSWGGTAISDAFLGIQRNDACGEVFASGILLEKTANEMRAIFENVAGDEPLTVQNAMGNVLTAQDMLEIIDMVELATDADGNSVLNFEKDSVLYMDAGTEPTGIMVWVNGTEVELPENGIVESPHRIFTLGKYSTGEVRIKITNREGYPLAVSGVKLGILDCENWENAVAEIADYNAIRMSVNEAKGKITVKASGVNNAKTLILPMAYTDGWYVSNDGKKYDAVPIFDGILGVEIEESMMDESNLELIFSFIPKGLSLGIGFFLIGIMILLISLLLDNYNIAGKWKEKTENIGKKPSYAMFAVVFGAGLLIVYIIPNGGLVVNAAVRVLGLETTDNVVEQPPIRVAQITETEDGIMVDLVEENLMLKKGVRVKADSLENKEFDADLIKDGITDETENRWSSENNWENNEHWLQVDFREEIPVTCIKLFWERTNACEYAIEYSVDKKEWKTVAKFEEPAKAKEQTIFLDTPVQTRYLRLHVWDVTKNEEDLSLYYQNVSLAEMEVYGKSAGSMLIHRPQIGTGTGRTLEIPEVEDGYTLRFGGADYENLIDEKGNIADTLSDVEAELGFVLCKDGLEWELPGIKTVIPASEQNAASVDFNVAEYKTVNAYSSFADDVCVLLPETEIEDADLLQKMSDLFLEELESSLRTNRVSANEMQMGKIGTVAFVLETEEENNLGEEGCEIQIEEEMVSIIANTARGIRYGCVSLLDLLNDSSNEFGQGILVQGIYRDYPRYEVRGFGIDVGRRIISMDFLYRVVEELSVHKMNTLQIHLNDNQIISESEYDKTIEGARKLYTGFRLESNIKNKDGIGITSTDFYYTKEEFAKFIDDAAVYGIEIVPEIDTPAHSLALTKVFPELGINNDPEAADMLDLSKKEARQLGKDIWSDAIAVFENCSALHLGMDEYYGDAKDFMVYMEELSNHVSTLAPEKELRIWGSLTMKGGDLSRISRDLQMHIWDVDWADPMDMYEEGFSLINSLKNNLYLIPGSGYDRLDTDYLRNEWRPNVYQTPERTWILPAWSERCLGACYMMWNDWAHLNGEAITEDDLYQRFEEPLEVIADKLW